jgi:hypothetical protein
MLNIPTLHCTRHNPAQQGKQILSDGIGRASEVEEDVSDVTTARGWLEQPGAMLQASPLLKGLNE